MGGSNRMLSPYFNKINRQFLLLIRSGVAG